MLLLSLVILLVKVKENIYRVSKADILGLKYHYYKYK